MIVFSLKLAMSPVSLEHETNVRELACGYYIWSKHAHRFNSILSGSMARRPYRDLSQDELMQMGRDWMNEISFRLSSSSHHDSSSEIEVAAASKTHWHGETDHLYGTGSPKKVLENWMNRDPKSKNEGGLVSHSASASAPGTPPAVTKKGKG